MMGPRANNFLSICVSGNARVMYQQRSSPEYRQSLRVAPKSLPRATMALKPALHFKSPVMQPRRKTAQASRFDDEAPAVPNNNTFAGGNGAFLPPTSTILGIPHCNGKPFTDQHKLAATNIVKRLNRLEYLRKKYVKPGKRDSDSKLSALKDVRALFKHLSARAKLIKQAQTKAKDHSTAADALLILACTESRSNPVIYTDLDTNVDEASTLEKVLKFYYGKLREAEGWISGYISKNLHDKRT